jgi:hypothetical protein
VPEEKVIPLRGLAAASPTVRRRVSQIGGLVAYIKASDEQLQLRAEKGGAAILERYGISHFSKMGYLRWQRVREMKAQQVQD